MFPKEESQGQLRAAATRRRIVKKMKKMRTYINCTNQLKLPRKSKH
jgi:hypothetical protein